MDNRNPDLEPRFAAYRRRVATLSPEQQEAQNRLLAYALTLVLKRQGRALDAALVAREAAGRAGRG